MWKKYAARDDHGDGEQTRAEDVRDGALARRPSTTSGSAAIAACPSRSSVRVDPRSAPAGCLRASQCTDSGMKKNTIGMKNSVTLAPK